MRAIVCDAPARAMVKAVKLCSGYFCYDKCTQEGVWLGRIAYQKMLSLHLRTDKRFRTQQNEEHHLGISPFCELQTDMVKLFSNRLYGQVCFGVMRLLLVWIRRKNETCLSARQTEVISVKLIQMQKFMPKLFVFKPRSLAEIDRWKATEYRRILLYTGKTVLKGILPSEQYNHFMSLSVAVCILICPKLANQHKERKYANQLLQYFVSKSKKIYGKE